MALSREQIADIRQRSRQLVRELGFMRHSLAGSGLSPSAVHALIEIGARPGLLARDLAQSLLLEKSTVSRLVSGLRAQGLVREEPAQDDARAKALHLTPDGLDRLAAIDRFAEDQLRAALGAASPQTVELVRTGLATYADALTKARSGAETGAKPVLREGYVPGLLARITLLHARYYSRAAGFGRAFEAVVASGMADFLSRLDAPVNATWHVDLDGEIMGGISIDGQDLDGGIAHLRWFILDPSLRGRGMGQALMQAAMGFCRMSGFAEVHLWTFDGLSAARALYDRHGFELVEQARGAQWGREVLEQKMVCRL